MVVPARASSPVFPAATGATTTAVSPSDVFEAFLPQAASDGDGNSNATFSDTTIDSFLAACKQNTVDALAFGLPRRVVLHLLAVVQPRQRILGAAARRVAGHDARNAPAEDCRDFLRP
jgi:hypothetical protein